MGTFFLAICFIVLLFRVVAVILFKRYEKIENLKNNSRYQSIPKQYLEVVDFFWTKYQICLIYPENSMSIFTVKPKGFLLILLVFILGLVGMVFLTEPSFVFVIMGFGLIFSVLYILVKEIAYFDNERLIDIRSVNLFKTKYKRQDILFSEIEYVKISTYSFRSRQKIIFLFYLKNKETFKIDVEQYGNSVFINELTRKLENTSLILP